MSSCYPATGLKQPVTVDHKLDKSGFRAIPSNRLPIQANYRTSPLGGTKTHLVAPEPLIPDKSSDSAGTR